jgi:hypothetical protein
MPKEQPSSTPTSSSDARTDDIIMQTTHPRYDVRNFEGQDEATLARKTRHARTAIAKGTTLQHTYFLFRCKDR